MPKAVRRSRTTSSSTPTRASPARYKDRTHHGAEPARAASRAASSAATHRRARRVHLRARRAAPLEGAPRGRHQGGARQGLPRQDARSARTTRSRSTCTPAPARTSAAKRRRCSTRSRARRGEPRMKPPFPAQAGAFGCPTHGEQPRDHRRRARRRSTWAATSSASSPTLHHLNDGGVRLFGVNGHVKKPGVVECARRAHAARAHLRPRRRRPRRPRAPRRHPRRLVAPGPSPGRDR